MVRATRTTSYETDTEIASSSSSTSTLTQPNFRATSTSNPINATPTPPHTSNTNTTSSPPVHVPDVAPSAVLPYLPPPPARLQITAPPTHALRLPHPTFTPQPTLPSRPLPPFQLPVPSPKPFEQPIQQSISLHSFVEAIDKHIRHSEQQHRHYERQQEKQFMTMQK